ncbi:DegT/DnrJ/EryC1/StrS family aminotransferase [Vibrio parahaemolyticus]|nr:DegT/DnrJ/EryC1/StrS family aminotransferase [Vibrio parahaemolyticus]HCG5273791.1 DegT/DnrJ/EryC1/StrS family aminotransferase [Vibrio parahaemolyticus]
MDNIPVTKPYLPNVDKLKGYIDEIYKSEWLTNKGPLLCELEKRLSDYLGVKHVICVANGSLALQVAYKALDINGEVITTPFSFAATSSTLLWENIKPVFCDVNIDTFNLDPKLIEGHITENTSAILPVHVFGNPCEVEDIQDIAERYQLKVIYDAAHAFGVDYKEKSVLKYGDVSTLSFHATKLFHTIEGGAVITDSDDIAKKVRKLINFGITGPDKIEGVGTNAKMNEFEAAMGLCVLDDIESIKGKRLDLINKYVDGLKHEVKLQSLNNFGSQICSYMPIALQSENELLKVKEYLESQGVFPRRYFYPSLDLAYDSKNLSPNSIDLSKRILCLPLYHELSDVQVNKVVEGVKSKL